MRSFIKIGPIIKNFFQKSDPLNCYIGNLTKLAFQRMYHAVETHIKMLLKYRGGIFSEIDGPLDFDETLVNGSVLNVVHLIIFVFLRKSLFKKLSALKAVYFVWNSEENKTYIFHIYCMVQIFFE